MGSLCLRVNASKAMLLWPLMYYHIQYAEKSYQCYYDKMSIEASVKELGIGVLLYNFNLAAA